MTNSTSDDDEERYVIVPSASLSAAALDGLVEEFITREGTDYGERTYSLEEKKRDVARLLQRGEAVIVFDLELESTTLIRREDLPKAG